MSLRKFLEATWRKLFHIKPGGVTETCGPDVFATGSSSLEAHFNATYSARGISFYETEACDIVLFSNSNSSSAISALYITDSQLKLDWTGFQNGLLLTSVPFRA